MAKKFLLAIILALFTCFFMTTYCSANTAAPPAAEQQGKAPTNKKSPDNQQKKADNNNTASSKSNPPVNHDSVTNLFYKIAGGVFLLGTTNLFILLFQKKKKQKKQQQANREAIIAAGKEGEKQTAFHLSFLPTEYTVLHNVIIRSNGLKAENDHIIIGPCGIALVETKNFGGTIYVHPNGWAQEKFGKKEGCNSPIAQSERHKMVLQSFLKKKGFSDIPIHIVVAIANEKAMIVGEDPRCPVLKAENLLHWVTNLPALVPEEQISSLRQLFTPNPSTDNKNALSEQALENNSI